MAPGRCGIFLSKKDLYEVADRVQVPIGFGDRGLMLANLLRGAGSQGRVPETLEALQNTVRQWMNSYSGWILEYPVSAALWRVWLARTEATEAMLTEMESAAAHLSEEAS
jgi:hypothetical protein